MLDIQIWTILVQGLSFLALVFVLNVVMYKPIIRFVQEREGRLSEAQGRVDALHSKIEEKAAAYENALNRAKSAALSEKNRFIAEALAKAKETTDAAHNEIPAMLETFHQQLNKELEASRLILKERSAHIASEIAVKVLGRGI